MISLDVATVGVQWAVGGLLFLWVTTRRREVGIGYGWLLRGTYLLMALGAFALGVWRDPVVVREVSTLAVVAATAFALGVSITRRGAGVAGERADRERRAERVAAMVDRDPGSAGRPPAGTTVDARVGGQPERPARELREFPPALDLIAPLVGIPGLIAAGIAAGDPAALSVVRTLVGAAFLGSISDAMLLGHWYLVQPGLARRPLLELVRWTGIIWPFEVAALLWPTGVASVLTGSIDDGFNGFLGWFWVASAAATIVLVVVTRAALRERYYSAVMAATGLLYLAILTAFGTDLVARALLA